MKRSSKCLVLNELCIIFQWSLSLSLFLPDQRQKVRGTYLIALPDN